MKTKNLLVLIVVLSLAPNAQARLVDSANNVNNSYQGENLTPPGPDASTWEKLRYEAQKKVNQWSAFFNSKMAEWKNDKPQTNPSATVPERKVASEGAPVVAPVPSAIPIAAHSAEEQKQFKDVIEQTRAEVRNKEAIQVSSPGRAGTTQLPKTKGGVPVFSLSKKETKKDKSGKTRTVQISVKEIPRLDIGEEKTIAKNDFIPPQLSVSFRMNQKPKELPSPELNSQKSLAKWLNMKVPVIAKAQPPKNKDIELGQIVTQKKIEAVSLEMVPTKPLTGLLPYKPFSDEEMDMLAAVILYEKGDKCHLASGLLSFLADKKQFTEEANFYLGICAHQMGFHSEAVNRLLKVVGSENPDFTKEAVTNLVEDLPPEYDAKVASTLKGLKNKNFIEEKAKDNVNYVLARAAHGASQFDEAAQYAERVSEKSAHYAKAHYLYGIGLYGQKKVKEAEQALLATRGWIEKKGKSDKNVEALIAMNVARIRFTQGRYQAANDEYLKIPKDHPLWVQGLIEQGWTQLNIDDPEGAIGNMYSLHSPYFKSVFMPESWVVRTIGYIDICQYGDAYRTLTRLEQLHGGWKAAVEGYMKSKKGSAEYYNTVKNYIRGRSDQNVDGLPFQIIREIARQRGFLNAQNAINTLEDELGQYNFIYGLVKKDQADVAQRLAKTKVRLAKVKADIAKAKTMPELIKNLNEWQAQRRNEEALVRAYDFQSDLFEQSRKGYLKMKGGAVARIESDKGKLRTKAGTALISHLKDVHSRISEILEGNEFLRYEIFAGSGENIRFQVSGGQTGETKRIPANVKPQKILNWEFDGEYWEDEIGSYRSTLKNNCPKNARSAQILEKDGKKTAHNFK